jgi:hypothetical protein
VTSWSGADRLRRWTDRFLAALDGAPVEDPVLPAVLHTIGCRRAAVGTSSPSGRAVLLDVLDRHPAYLERTFARLSHHPGCTCARSRRGRCGRGGMFHSIGHLDRLPAPRSPLESSSLALERREE